MCTVKQKCINWKFTPLTFSQVLLSITSLCTTNRLFTRNCDFVFGVVSRGRCSCYVNIFNRCTYLEILLIGFKILANALSRILFLLFLLTGILYCRIVVLVYL